jgi:hypothetical protein
VPQVKPHFVPSQLACEAPVGTGQLAHAVRPQEFTLVFESHTPPQSWLPVSHTPEHEAVVAMQEPAHSFWLAGQAPPQVPPVQVAVPPMGTAHAVHDEPHVATSVLLTHLPLQRWKPLAHESEHVPETQMGVPFAPVGQAMQEVPHAVASLSRAQSDVHLCSPGPQVKSHVVPSQVAASACAGTGQGVHDVPQEFTSWSDEQRSPQACVPTAQEPSQPDAASMQTPWQSFLLAGQAPPQARETQVAVPPTGSAQRVQDVPHDFGSSELTHAPEQMCSSALHVGPDGALSAGASSGTSATGPSVAASFFPLLPPAPAEPSLPV